MTDKSYRLEYYLTDKEECPFTKWLIGLRDRMTVARIRTRLDRICLGNFGVVKPVGDGAIELKIDFGPGYRVYYAMNGKTVVLLLIGGDKSTQQKDIEMAKRFWTDYRMR
jgi:putative addiction module killer protein